MTMELSPLQLQQLVFKKIFVEPTAGFEQVEALWAPGFDFNGVPLKVDVALACLAGEKDTQEYSISVRLVIDPDDPELNKQVPYAIDIEAQASLLLLSSKSFKDPKNIVQINGASLVIGAIRDMVHLLTARGVFGPMLIPTLRILPTRAEETQAEEK